MFCCAFLYVPSSFATILMGRRELFALLVLSSLWLVVVVWLFLAVPWVSLQFVIVVFPDHTHLLFFIELSNILCLIETNALLAFKLKFFSANKEVFQCQGIYRN